MTTFEVDDPHALLRAVIRLETKVDQMLEAQRELRRDIGGIDERLRQVETKVAALEVDSRTRKAWPQVASAVAAVVAIAIALFR